METTLDSKSTGSPQEVKSFSWRSIEWKKYRSMIALVVIMVVLGFLTDGNFVSARNLTNLARQIAINGILAVGMTYVILLGGIDLSVGSVVALAGVMTGILQVNHGLAQWAGAPAWGASFITMLAAVLTGLLCGLFNGWCITRYKIAPFIITLGMMVIARGLALIFSNGAAIAPLSDHYNLLGNGFIPPVMSVILVGGAGVAIAVQRLMSSGSGAFARMGGAAVALGVSVALCWVFYGYQGLPIPVLIFGALGLAGMLVLRKTRLGRYVLASGGNPEAAWLAGVPIRKITFGIYAVLGALAGLSGAVLSARLNGALPTAGDLFELDAIAAVVIGGTSLTGGIGTVQGSILGAVFIGALNNGMSLLEVTEFYQKVIKGVIIILAVWFDTREAGKAKKGG